MSDRYDDGYNSAKKYYTRKFNFRGELLLDLKHEWTHPARAREREVITKSWPGLAKHLDETVGQADEMRGETR